MKPSNRNSQASGAVLADVDEHHRNLRYNVTLIGWLGVVVSLTVILCSGLTMQWAAEVARVILYMLYKGNNKGHAHHFLIRFIMTVGAVGYALAIVNIVVCLLLLIGVSNGCYKMLLPWLLYHGFLFGVTVHMALYSTISGMLLDFRAFVIILAVFAMALIIFFKISYEVFLLYKLNWRASRGQISENSSLASGSTQPNVLLRPVVQISSDV